MQASLEKLQNNWDAVKKARKEKGFYRQAVVLDSDDGAPVVTARWYWPGRDGASRCYCCVWLRRIDQKNGVYDCDGSGGGYAGESGYDKPSAALAAALAAAGVELSDPIAGRGETAEDAALLAIARAAIGGKRRLFLYAHGFPRRGF
jgi:hypothetical protein